MEEKKTNAAQGSRFGTGGASKRPTGSFRERPAGSYKARAGYAQAAERRRPTGFENVGASRKRPAAPADDADTRERTKEEKRLERRLMREEQKTRHKRQSERRSKRIWLSVTLVVLGFAIVLALLVLLIGRGDARPHMLPSVQLQQSETADELGGNA